MMVKKNNKSRSPRKKLIINSKEHWEVLRSTTRAAIIECLSAIGASSIKEIAASLGRSAELVHHHMPILLECGFVIECEPRQLARHTERVFSNSGLEWVFDPTSDPEAFAEGMSRMARAWSRANERLVSEALSDKDGSQLTELIKTMTVRSESAYLRPAAENKVRQHLEAIKKIFQTERASSDGNYRSVFWSLVPVENGR